MDIKRREMAERRTEARVRFVTFLELVSSNEVRGRGDEEEGRDEGRGLLGKGQAVSAFWRAWVMTCQACETWAQLSSFVIITLSSVEGGGGV